jgi:flagellar basal body-associated protein FliL
MSPQPKKQTRRRVIIIGTSVLFLAALATAGYFFFFAQQKPSVAPASQKAKEQVASLNFQGDAGIQERYVDLINANKKDEAQKLFDDAVAHEPNIDKKIELLQSNVLLALQYKLVDKAEAAALRSLDVKEGIDSYEGVLRVYTVKGDIAKWKEYNAKARAFVEKSDLENKDSLLKSYDEQLASMTDSGEGE